MAEVTLRNKNYPFCQRFGIRLPNVPFYLTFYDQCTFSGFMFSKPRLNIHTYIKTHKRGRSGLSTIWQQSSTASYYYCTRNIKTHCRRMSSLYMHLWWLQDVLDFYIGGVFVVSHNLNCGILRKSVFKNWMNKESQKFHFLTSKYNGAFQLYKSKCSKVQDIWYHHRIQRYRFTRKQGLDRPNKFIFRDFFICENRKLGSLSENVT